MNARLREFVENAAHDVIGLDVALFFQANPSTFDTAAGLALRLHWRGPELERALERLVQHGVLETFTRGDGRYRCYALSRDPQVWHLLCQVSEAYLDEPETRKEIVRMLVRARAADRCGGNTDPTQE